ncbi:DUF2851 family protein [Pelagicoccus sp. SDUM812005]|uniref:DUF2851 family protein n=1 Tax=Pelagicoccus sp. SDUM812005 TaxID=3041257 RepID=UPI00280D5163|nr:DUF2851 family protein [Pelagicoccus sp. SDUM812005]MDQ8182562.1 DUF2851 family protein [Pelagicoccus sp. SDUM812005]
MPHSTCLQSVEEFHGPYGPYQVSELVLQKIWLEQAFDLGRLCDQFGRLVEVIHPGTWNRLDGPDFRDAILRIDGVEVRGDVEMHFSQADWNAHGHQGDAAYDGVVLHVLYYTPAKGSAAARTRSGAVLPTVALLPLLWYSLEEYAGDDSLIASTGVDLRPEVETLMNFSLAERRRQLVGFAQRRWKMKCHYAAQRIERLGWTGACHQSALEVMGFARNRVPMLMIAERHSLADCARGGLTADLLMDVGEDRWRMSGCRPANHPRLRLQQYLQLAAAAEDWPERLADWGEDWVECQVEPEDEEWGTQALRCEMGVAKIRKFVTEEILVRKIGGQKADTLVCDALLPLVAARRGMDGFAAWFHWNAGNGPASCTEALRLLQVLERGRTPMSNGWLQGVLGAKSRCHREEDGGSHVQAHA